MSTIYPTSVKQKLVVNALLALCPVMLWVAHSIAGRSASHTSCSLPLFNSDTECRFSRRCAAGLSFTSVQSSLWMVDALVWSLSVAVEPLITTASAALTV